MDHTALEQEVDRNYEAFLREQPALMRDHSEEHVLIRRARMISFHPDVVLIGMDFLSLGRLEIDRYAFGFTF